MSLHIDKIVNWLKSYTSHSRMDGFVVGISGGIDSAVTSTLCALTGMRVTAVSLPINQDKILDNRSEIQKDWLAEKFENVEKIKIDLSSTFNAFEKCVSSSDLGYANSKSRIRMVALYAIATEHRLLVAGTGNKVEDFGVGFFTKYGDGGVDLSPIADLTKTEVYDLAKELGIPQEIQEASPTDGLWDDGREDETQLGASYTELEWAMDYESNPDRSSQTLTKRQKEVLAIYNKHHQVNLHKMLPIPVCKLD